MSEIVMPRLSDTMEEGTILRWLKQDGEHVARGEELVEIETDKAAMTYESDTEGTLETVAREGDTLAVGELIARIGERDDQEQEASGAPPQRHRSRSWSRTPRKQLPMARTRTGSTRVPKSRRRPMHLRAAREGLAASPTHCSRDGSRSRQGLWQRSRWAHRQGRCRGGRGSASRPYRRTRADLGGCTVCPSPESPTPPSVAELRSAKGETTSVELTRTQRTIARRMAESKATIPDFTLTADIDMERCVELRAELKRLSHTDVPTYNDMIVKACALALREHPRANGSYRDGGFELHSRVNVGVAVAVSSQDPTAGALVVPTVFDADTKALGEIARETRALAQRVRDGSVTPPELSGGTLPCPILGCMGSQASRRS